MHSRIKVPRISTVVLFLGIATIPIYALDSGGMQASHLLLFLFSLGFIVRHGVGLHAIDLFLAFLVGLAIVREAFAVAAGAPVSSFTSAAHVFYVTIVVNVMRRSLESPSRLGTFKLGFLAALFVAVAGVLIFGYGLTVDPEGERAVGTFNNPNQLGYFAVCSASLGVFLKQRGELGARGLTFLLAAAVFLAAASLSKAAMICVFAVLLLSGYVMAPRRGLVIVGLVFATVAAVGAWALYESGLFDDFAFIQRLERLGTQQDDSLAARGYDIFDHASVTELFLGLGSAAVHDIRGREIHSTVFSFFGNYGIAGGLLFVGALIAWTIRVRRGYGWIGVALLVVPPMAYGITHNGSRFVIFWLLVCVSMGRPPQLALRSWRTASNVKPLGSWHGDAGTAR